MKNTEASPFADNRTVDHEKVVLGRQFDCPACFIFLNKSRFGLQYVNKTASRLADMSKRVINEGKYLRGHCDARSDSISDSPSVNMNRIFHEIFCDARIWPYTKNGRLLRLLYFFFFLKSIQHEEMVTLIEKALFLKD